MTDLAIHEDRSASPPGRESREDWRGGGGNTSPGRRNGRSPLSEKKGRARSRSPLRGGGNRAYSPTREMRYSRDGTNTTSREPHLERARLFVGNIEPNRTHRRDLIKLFSKYGDVLGVSVHKGYAFVQMDRERAANKAINFEDNTSFMGSRIHVEFSQAALKAGAKFERLSPPNHYWREGSPPRERLPPPPPPPPSHDPYYAEDQERQREERLARILQMEREIAYLRSREDVPVPETRRPPRPAEDFYDRYDGRRTSPRPANPPGYDSSYSRDREPSYRGGAGAGGGGAGGIGGSGGAGGMSGRGGFYTRQSPTGDFSRGATNEGSYRDPVSYPSQYSGGGSLGNSYARSAPTVGYGGAGGKGGSGLNSSLPPGWPSGDDKPTNRAPFTNPGPWS